MDIRLGIFLVFLATNVATFLIMLADKSASKNAQNDRVSEGLLFFMAVMFGSVGVYLGMLLFHHKTRKWYFILGIPMAALQNVATLYVISLFL